MNQVFSKFFSQKQRVKLLLVLLILIGGVVTAFAINSVSEGYRLTSTVQTVNAHTVCRTAKTTSGNDVFAPTKTVAEWNAFVAHKPANVTLGSCEVCTAWTYYHPQNSTGLGSYWMTRESYNQAFIVWGATGAVYSLTPHSLTSYTAPDGSRYERGSFMLEYSDRKDYAVRRCTTY